jgi:diacylglycerol O-acyltransferase
VTNVPGPPVPIYSAGARLESMMGLLCLTDGMGLGHVVQSYCKEATISFTACRKVMPDPEFYAQCIEDSFTELRDAARAIKDAPEPAPAATVTKPKARAKAPAAKAADPAAKNRPKRPAARKTTVS